MHNLSLTREAQGDVDGVRAVLERALEGRGQVLGEQHPDTVDTERILGRLLRRARR